LLNILSFFRQSGFRGKSAVMMLGAVLLCLPAMVCSAQSASYITEKDLEVSVRAFSFVYGMPKGSLDIEVVYDPGNPDSAGEAHELKKIIGDGNEFAKRAVTAKLVPVSQMGSTGDRIAYITHGLEPQYGAILQKAGTAKMLTFSTDFQCVTSQKCVMGVEASPAIKMEISRSATTASGLEFSQALKLMIREVE
jgi:hypothetical protein